MARTIAVRAIWHAFLAARRVGVVPVSVFNLDRTVGFVHDDLTGLVGFRSRDCPIHRGLLGYRSVKDAQEGHTEGPCRLPICLSWAAIVPTLSAQLRGPTVVHIEEPTAIDSEAMSGFTRSATSKGPRQGLRNSNLVMGNSVVAFQDGDGLIFYRQDQIATLTPEYRGRWRGVLADGAVVHRPGCPEGPWPQMGESRVNSRHLRATEGGAWKDRADFVYEGDAPPALEEPVWPEIPGQDLNCLEVWGVEVQAGGTLVWLTDRGPMDCTVSLQELPAHHPDLICCGKQWWVNPQRLRRLRFLSMEQRFLVEMDNGQLLTTLNKANAQALVVGLGLANPKYLGDGPCLLTERELRDYPLELDTTPADQLKAWFKTARQALSNIIYQTVRYRQQGRILEGYGTDHSSYLYKPVHSVMVRLGFWKSEAVMRMDPKLREQFETVLNDLVGRDALFTYQQLGFLDDGSRRHLGDRRPEVLLVFEKVGFRRYAEELSRRFGVSYIITGGMPKVLESEYLAAALTAAGTGPIRIIAFTDFDPAGWALPEALASQLQRYGVEFSQPVQYLVRADCFSAEEIELFAIDCPMGSPSLATFALEWVKKSGGVNGLPRGIHANHFQPLARVASELEKFL